MTKIAQIVETRILLKSASYVEQAFQQSGVPLDQFTDEEVMALAHQAVEPLAAAGAFEEDLQLLPQEDLDELKAQFGDSVAPGESDLSDEGIEPEAVIKFASSQENQGKFAAHAAYNEYVRLWEAAIAQAQEAEKQAALAAPVRPSEADLAGAADLLTQKLLHIAGRAA